MEFKTPKMWVTVACMCLMLIPMASGAEVAVADACTPGTDTCPTGAECLKPSDSCDKGLCLCTGDYAIVSVEETFTCKLKKKEGDKCDDATDTCIGGMLCQSSPKKCSCPTDFSFNQVLNKCLADTLKLLDGECNEVANCYTEGSVTDSVDCATKEGGGETKYCQCKANYQKTTYMCRKPSYDETCETTPGCSFNIGSGIANSDSTSIKDEICEASGDTKKCTCPAQSTYKTFGFPKADMTVSEVGACIADNAGTKKAEKAECTTMNQCEDGLICQACPGDNNGKCIKAGTKSGADTVTVSVFLLAFSSLLLRFW